MKIIISDKNKKEKFIALFHALKNSTSIVNIVFCMDSIHIQGIDKSHICMFDVNLKSSWFNEYLVEKKTTVCFDTTTFYAIITSDQESNIIIHYDELNNSDNIHINLLCETNLKTSKQSKHFNKYFKIPLMDYDYEFMDIPNTEYDAEFSIPSKIICEIIGQMMTFGDNINIKCSEEKIDLITNGVMGEMLVNIPIEELTEYSVVENDIIDLTYSLHYIHKMCLTNKLSPEILFFISKESPMKIEYHLDDDGIMIFFIAPKIGD